MTFLMFPIFPFPTETSGCRSDPLKAGPVLKTPLSGKGLVKGSSLKTQRIRMDKIVRLTRTSPASGHFRSVNDIKWSHSANCVVHARLFRVLSWEMHPLCSRLARLMSRGHAHPVSAMEQVGTQNATNLAASLECLESASIEKLCFPELPQVALACRMEECLKWHAVFCQGKFIIAHYSLTSEVTASNDGRLCVWSLAMLNTPQEIQETSWVENFLRQSLQTCHTGKWFEMVHQTGDLIVTYCDYLQLTSTSPSSPGGDVWSQEWEQSWSTGAIRWSPELGRFCGASQDGLMQVLWSLVFAIWTYPEYNLFSLLLKLPQL